MIFNQPKLLLALFFILVFGLSIWGYKKLLQKDPYVLIGSQKILVEVASSDADKARGLSGREKLLSGHGMLFVWREKIIPQFWMPDMNFAIDIIWISDNKIIGIEKNVQPQPGVSAARLRRYFPPEPVNFVLEVNSGFSDQHNLKLGDQVFINF